MDPEIKREFDRIHTKLSNLYQLQKRKETWVNASWIMELTGFSKEKMRRARMQGIIKFKKTNTKTYTYLLESVSEHFIKKDR